MDRATEFRQIGDVISNTSNLAHAGKWEELDNLLVTLDMSQSTVLLLSWARSTYPMRTKCPNWQDTIFRIKEEFDSRGENSELLLKGLL